MISRDYISFFFLVAAAICSSLQVNADPSFSKSPFSVALDTLQAQINYTFENVGLLRRAMTHSSYSEENNKALSILGEKVIETSVSMLLLVHNIDTSSSDLNDKISQVSKVETSCAGDGMRLNLQNIVRVSSNTNSSTPSVVCGAFRAILGAVSLDTESTDSAGKLFLKIHAWGALAM
ncbi:protein NUCLEAR FUSION DEFECTIVE 2 [Ipomoea triloba]|uniref:protein NUCLEAR FUSION DEFECTIVE 2 n=1 Tax=Ipomoea triloba TaxID=35885 RepID=UPI00125E680F|nr:protein NUCLEAR FUSION DEFECTIVE 2 [Ipomoea triloba]